MSNTIFSFQAKNGQVEIDCGGQVHIGRRGWFGPIYQIFTRGKRNFELDEIETVVLKEPGIMRGYLRFESAGGNGVVWLTNPKMARAAREAKKCLEKLKEQRQRALTEQTEA